MNGTTSGTRPPRDDMALWLAGLGFAAAVVDLATAVVSLVAR